MRHLSRNRSRGFARAARVLLPCLALSSALLLASCKGGGGPGEAQAKEGEKGPEATNVVLVG